MNDIVCWKLKFFWNYWTDEIKMPEAPLRKAMQVCKLKQIHLCAHWKGWSINLGWYCYVQLFEKNSESSGKKLSYAKKTAQNLLQYEKRLLYSSILSHVVTNPGEWKYWMDKEKVAKLMERLPRATPLTI